MKILKQSIGGILIIILIFSINSCRVTKDRKAVARVTYDSSLFNQVGRKWAVSNPCPPGSVTYISGIESIDTLYQYSNSVDTVINKDTLFIPGKTITVTITKLRVDTMQVPDNRAVQLAKDDLNRANGTITQLKKDNADLKASNNKKIWWLAGGGIVWLLSTGLLVYLLIRKV